MPVMIPLTTPHHGGRVHTGLCGTEHCGVDCNCGCPYSNLEQNGKLELIAEVEARYPGEWLAFVVPPDEDEERPERGMLVVHSFDDNEVWDAVRRITHNQVVHVYYNGPYDLLYEAWADSEPLPPGVQEPLPLEESELIPLLQLPTR